MDPAVAYVCPECFGDESLKRRIRDISSGESSERCDVHGSGPGVPVEKVAKIVDEVFRQNFANDADGDDLQTCLYELTGGQDDATEALARQLIADEICLPQDGDEPFYGEDMEYKRGDFMDAFRGWLWSRFRESIIHDQRFFNQRAKDTLKEIFDGVHRQQDQQGQGAVYLIDPGSEKATFYRARIFERHALPDKIAKDITRNLGPPPERLRRAGRLNPAGILTFYGAFDLDTCISELRPRRW
jgi:hypothetical protein